MGKRSFCLVFFYRYVTKAALKPFPRILPPSVGCLIYGVSDSELRSAVLHSRAMQLRKSCSGERGEPQTFIRE